MDGGRSRRDVWVCTGPCHSNFRDYVSGALLEVMICNIRLAGLHHGATVRHPGQYSNTCTKYPL